MLKFVTKEDYWSVLDQEKVDQSMLSRLFDQMGKTTDFQKKIPWHLKSIQDSIALSYLQNCEELEIGEIGGGNSRVLPELCAKNTCYNIDEFLGAGSGPTKRRSINGVTNIFANRTPCLANESIAGVLRIGCPAHPSMSER